MYSYDESKLSTRAGRIDVAVLAVGVVDVPQFQRHHAAELMRNVVLPLTADVYGVLDATGGQLAALQPIFGARLRALTRVPPPNLTGHGLHHLAEDHRQWHKLREAWRLLEVGEAARGGAEYGIVIKLRLDSTPVPSWAVSKATIFCI